MKKTLLFALPVLLFAFGAIAETTVNSAQRVQPAATANVQEEVKREIERVRLEMQQKREETKANKVEANEAEENETDEGDDDSADRSEEARLKALRQQAKEEFEARREAAKTLMEQKREEMKDAMEAERAEAKALIEDEKEELRDRLAKIRDERKKEVIERLYENLNSLNERVTGKLAEKIDRIEEILSRVQIRADKAEVNGLDISSADAAIAAAVKMIEDARTAVRTQAGKSYTIEVTDEATLREKAKAAKEQLREDLAAARDAVKLAMESVRKAAVALAQIPRVDEAEVSDDAETESAQ